MKIADTTTIAAIATAAGGGVGVIRLSGPDALTIAGAYFTGFRSPPPPRQLVYGWWTGPGGERLDEGLAVYFPGPRSYTGEDVVELHLHGGALSLQRCLRVCFDAGADPAGPGEFTQRAFLNGRMDLTRAEAIADMVAARTDQALRQARSHLGGGLYAVAMEARESLLMLRARLEVNIDFVEEDVPLMDPSGLAAEARRLGEGLTRLAGTWQRGHLWRDGARVVLAGRPNAGKSSLFNALLEDDRAIVTPIAGTTRDAVDATVDILGVPVVLVDTAGLRETDDEVEAHGVARSQQQMERADLVLHVIEPGPDPAQDHNQNQDPAPARSLIVWTKHDLADAVTVDGADTPDGCWVSALTGHGLDALRRAIVEALGGSGEGGNRAEGLGEGGLVITRERHRVALERGAEALEQAAVVLEAAGMPELAAVDIQEATDCLAELVGLSTIEDVLDRLFSSFCIGK